MLKRVHCFRLALPFCCLGYAVLAGCAARAQTGVTLQVKEISLGRLLVPGIIAAAFTVSPDNEHVAYVAQQGDKLFVVVDGKSGTPYDDIGDGPFFSPDGQHVAFATKQGDKWLIVVDSKPGTSYDGIGDGPFFSPDSQHVAFATKQGDKQFVVVDGKPSTSYDGFLKGSKLIFDSPTSLHTLATRDNTVYRVEVTITRKP